MTLSRMPVASMAVVYLFQRPHTVGVYWLGFGDITLLKMLNSRCGVCVSVNVTVTRGSTWDI